MTINENSIFDPNGPWTRLEVEAWIKQNILPNISKYSTNLNKDYFINELLPLRKINYGEYSQVIIKYYGSDLNYNMWNIDIVVDKPKGLKYMLCIGGPFDQTYENQYYAGEHDYSVFNQASKETKKYSSVLIHRSLLK